MIILYRANVNVFVFVFFFFFFFFFISLFMYLFFVEKKIGSCSSCSEEKSPLNGT